MYLCLLTQCHASWALFFDGPRGSEHGSRSQESFKSLQMILRPEGTMPLTYLKRIAIGTVAKKLSQFKE